MRSDTIGDIGKSELTDPDRYPKRGRDYSAWLDDVFANLDITRADISGRVHGWLDRMNHAIYRPVQLRRLVLLGPMGWHRGGPPFPFWSRSCLSDCGRPQPSLTRSSLDRWARARRSTAGSVRGCESWDTAKLAVGQPFHLSGRKLRKITTPTLVFLGGKDGLVGDVAPAKRRAQRYIAGCEIEVLPNAGHVMSVDEPNFVGTRIVEFLQDRPTVKK